MKTYLLALEIDRFEIGLGYRTLPLHCTLMPWFILSGSHEATDRLTGFVEHICSAYPSPRLNVYGDSMFGRSFDIPVHLVTKTAVLMGLHRAVFSAVKEMGAQVPDEEWAGDGYRPHIAIIEENTPGLHEEIITSRLVLIEKLSFIAPKNKFVRHASNFKGRAH